LVEARIMGVEEGAEKRPTLQTVGTLLRSFRLAADLTQEELAERAGVSARLISDLERGSIHRPRRDTVQLLADGLRLRGAERDSFVELARGRPLASNPNVATNVAARVSLPRPPTQIVGRLKETAAVVSMLLDPEVRLLTLIGPGGAGKTRLALDVAIRALDAFPDGVVFVDLAPVRDPALVLTVIAETLKVQPGPERSLRQALFASLDGQRLLLLDNFEHMLVAAPVVADMLASCPRLMIIATSRKPLHIRAEHLFPVGPLALPDLSHIPPLDELASIAAVELFLRRAQSVNREFSLTAENATTVAEIAVRLDGLPLAIELAAIRARSMSPAALLDHLVHRLPTLTGGFQDLPERQQALRATLDWSHELLTPEEQHLFRCLAVFAGGCTLEAAEYIGGSGAPGMEKSAQRSHGASTLEILTGLVDANLVRTIQDPGAESRFGMLETIREYGLDQLAAAGEEEEERRRHVEWCLDLAERAAPELIGAEQERWSARLALEHDNLRAGLGWAVAQRDAEAAMRLSGALYRFWATHGHFEEGRRWLDTALALDSGEASPAKGHALLGTGVMAFFQGDYAHAESLWQESLTLFRNLGDVTGVAYSFGNLGLVADAQGDYERASASYENALTLFRQLDNHTYVNYMRHNLGLIAYFQGNYERATALFEEALAWVRAQGDTNSVAMTLGNLGLIAFARGDYARALELHIESLGSAPLLTNKPWLARAIENFALVAAATREADRAARLFGAAAARRAELGASLPPNDQKFNARYIAQARTQIGDAAFAAAWQNGETMSLLEAIDFALGEAQDRLLRLQGALVSQR
jgi:predicted ATPase/transcriptional regulator with XRE-family HTH domain/Tfp pilus assembly protein PilF